jgi:hypothetical protein
MIRKWTVKHLGYPVTSICGHEHDWKVYSTHSTYSAACKRILKELEGVEPGTWNDHYKIFSPDGRETSTDEYINERELSARIRESKKHY